MIDITRDFDGTESFATAVSKGQVVGYTYGGLAFSWTAAGGVIDLGDLGGGFSQALDVDNGQVVGRAVPAADPFTHHGFLWTAEDGMMDLGTGTERAVAVRNGYVVDERGFIWTAEKGSVSLGLLRGRALVPRYVSPDGEVVGRSDDDSFSVPFLWTKEGGIVELGPFGGENRGWAERVNRGRVVGAWNGHAFSWTAADGMVDLGTLGGQFSAALDVDGNSIVGWADTPDGKSHAVLWTFRNGMVPCAGDCDGNGEVTVNELVLAVGIALGERGVSSCPSADMDASGGVEVNELVAAVGAALNGCGG